MLQLPLIKNKKTVNPRDSSTPPVFQLVGFAPRMLQWQSWLAVDSGSWRRRQQRYRGAQDVASCCGWLPVCGALVCKAWVHHARSPPSWQAQPLGLWHHSRRPSQRLPAPPGSPGCRLQETAMGSAIECFDDAGAVVVPRSRFAPVKTCNDLFALRSGADGGGACGACMCMRTSLTVCVCAFTPGPMPAACGWPACLYSCPSNTSQCALLCSPLPLWSAICCHTYCHVYRHPYSLQMHTR